MTQHYDAIIIGAGIIGAATAFELAKQGWKTLNIDKLPAAGYGSTSNSCAIIRVHYSTWDGIAMAYEGYFYWHEWAKYLNAADERGLADFIECGALVMKTEQNGKLAKHCELADKLGIPYEALGPDAIEQRLPIYEMKSYWPPKRMDDEGFAEPGEGRVDGGVFFPTAGYISDPQLATHNLQRAAEAKGGAFLLGRKVVEILTRDGRTAVAGASRVYRN